jgi:hypothetical protein
MLCEVLDSGGQEEIFACVQHILDTPQFISTVTSSKFMLKGWKLIVFIRAMAAYTLTVPFCHQLLEPWPAVLSRDGTGRRSSSISLLRLCWQVCSHLLGSLTIARL